MGLARCRPFELRAEVHRAPALRLLELALDRALCVRSKSLAVRMPRSRAANFRVRLSRVHKPIRNHLGASQVARVIAGLLDLFRWAKRKRWTSRKGCGLSCLLLAFRKCGKPQTVRVRLDPRFQHR